MNGGIRIIVRSHYVVAALILIGGVALLASTSVGAVNIASSTSYVTVFQERITPDADVLVRLQGHITQGGNRAANAVVCPGVEAAGNNPIARGDLIAGNLVYGGQIAEVISTSWDATRIYSVEVFGDGSLLRTLYFKNSNADGNQVEGVRFRVDLGGPSPTIDNYSTVVTRLNACP